MLDYGHGSFVKLYLGFTRSPSGAGKCLLLQEGVHDAFVLLDGYTPGLRAPDRKGATALVAVVGMSQSVYGYPNEEAFWCDDRGDIGHGFYEVNGSRPHANVLEYNQRTYGSRHPEWNMGGKYESRRIGTSEEVQLTTSLAGVDLERVGGGVWFQHIPDTCRET